MTRSVSNFVEGAGEVAAKTTRQERASVQSNGVIRNAELAGSPLREPSLVSKYTVPMSGQQRSSFSTVTFPTSPVPPVRSTFLKGSMKAKPRTSRQMCEHGFWCGGHVSCAIFRNNGCSKIFF